MRRVAIAGVLWLGFCVSAEAQTAPAEPPGPYVLDVHGAMVSLPNDAGFFPPLPASTAVPSVGYGIDAGVHVYPLQLGPARLGVGGMFVRARGTAGPSAGNSTATSPASAVVTTPEVAMLLTAFGPQISVNFGSRAGWSYLSAGVASATIRTRRSAFTDPARPNESTQARLLDSGSRSSINVGGGARWFARTHLAFSFDVRFHIVRSGGNPDTPGTTLVAAGAGISLK